MRDAAVRWTLFLVGLLALGPAAGWLTGRLRGADGFSSVEPILAASGGAVGMALAVGGIVLSIGFGALVARLTSTRWGYFCAGGVLAWVAAGTGRIDEILRVNPDRAQFGLIALEAAIFGVIAVGGAFLIGLAGRQGQRLDSVPHGHREARHDPAGDELGMMLTRAGVSVAACVVCGVLVSYVAAVSTLKGQTIASALIASALVGVVTGLLHKQAQGWVLVLGIALVAALAPAAALLLEPAGASSLLLRANAMELLAPARIMPLDWLAGALLGLPIGAKWGVGLATAEKS